MTAPPAEHRETRSASAAFAHDLTCVGCGYNLRGLSRDGRCPECGTRIGTSIDASQEPIAHPPFARSAALGAQIYSLTLLAVLLVVIAIAVISFFQLNHDIGVALKYVAFGGGVTSGVAAIFISTRHYAQHGHELLIWTLGLRLAAATIAGAAILYCVLVMDRWTFGGSSTWIQSISGGIGGFGILIVDCLYLNYLVRLTRHRQGLLTSLGWVTAWRALLIFLLVSFIPPVSRHSPPTTAALILRVAIGAILPMALLVWAAIFTWIWARTVRPAVPDR